MNIQQRIVKLITYLNWIILSFGSLIFLYIFGSFFARGFVFGGLIVTINFHILSKTLKNALSPERLGSYNVVLVKYYIRFVVSAVIILVLLQQKLVSPLGLFLGLSVVVLSVFFATALELKKIIFKEAV